MNTKLGGTIGIALGVSLNVLAGAGTSLVAQAPSPTAEPITYFIADGLTGLFFDTDLLIANPTDQPAPITITFVPGVGKEVVQQRVVEPRARLTINVDAIPGLQATDLSARVRSDAGVPLAVERTMFIDVTKRAGTTHVAVDAPSRVWFFAEGNATEKSFTFLFMTNPSLATATGRVTFFPEGGGASIVRDFTIEPSKRLALSAGDIAELRGKTFGFKVEASQPIVAERSMFLNNERFFAGGTSSEGATAPATQWSFTDGATGSFFQTLVLVANPGPRDARVTFNYVLGPGATVTVVKTVPANGRLTTNVADENPRLRDTNFQTHITSDVPVVVERSMFAATGDAHTSFGATTPATTWAFAEGRDGVRDGDALNFHTFLFLGNSQATPAEVTITYLRENGVPATQTVTVPALSTLVVNPGDQAVQDESFGIRVDVTNGVPIFAERSMFWDVNGVVFSGATNAMGIRLPVTP